MDGLHVWAWHPISPEEIELAGPLAGFLLAVKDVIDVAGMPTRAGSPLTAADPAWEDAPAIARLRAAGAEILGKSQCTEWALNDPAPTLNPWDPRRTPGGSSAGSAVAVATGLCTASVDTQTAGDIVRPAAYNGVTGLKPTYGWAPTQGSRAVAPSIDTLGVIARDVTDAAAVARAMADHPARFILPPHTAPPHTRPPGAAAPQSATPGATAPGATAPDAAAQHAAAPHSLALLAAPRIGVLRDPFCDDVGPAVRAGLADAVRRFAEAGAEVVEVMASVDLAAVHAAHRVITFAECALQHARRFRAHAGDYGPRARELIERGLATSALAYLDADRVRRDAAASLAALLDGVDVLLVPATPEPAPPRATTGDSRLQIPWTLCGFPTLVLPSGMSDGLPLAVQLVGAMNAEATLLAAGLWCESALDVIAPSLSPC
ncbi:amidase [Actinomadura barringtoniae]|uniref:Amidase n=1 Tax=Actinomadura barringtoniae TaxID=1427535 RepID=A0A939T565_9ACTN|nr:amidase [Actinomadura barringtoniae]MBO2450263.1 amidase [Actinomadura barringtoniae]